MTQGINSTLPGFAARLKMLRRIGNVKQSALSSEMGISQSTLSRWETGSQIPRRERQIQILTWLCAQSADDKALRRLVETSSDNVHLVDEANHKCLAYSPLRAREWCKEPSALMGQSLWRFATEEIRAAEAELDGSDWWAVRLPVSRTFTTSASDYPELVINAGYIRWERLYLADGTPVRLCTSYR